MHGGKRVNEGLLHVVEGRKERRKEGRMGLILFNAGSMHVCMGVVTFVKTAWCVA